jgi:hypothetical protein
MSHRILKSLRFTLQAGADRRRYDFCRGPVDEVCGLADGYSGFEIEEQGDTGKLIEMIHRLRAERFFPGDQRVQRHKVFAVIGLNVQ